MKWESGTENDDVIDQRPDHADDESESSSSSGSSSEGSGQGGGYSSSYAGGDSSYGGGSSYEPSFRGYGSQDDAPSDDSSHAGGSSSGGNKTVFVGVVGAVIIALGVVGILKYTGHLDPKSKTQSAAPRSKDNEKDAKPEKANATGMERTERKEAEKQDKNEKKAKKEKEKELVDFVKFVLKDQQDTFDKLYKTQRKSESYRHAKLVLFEDTVATGCGDETSRTGPFYCPKDERAYIDLRWFERLEKRYGAPGNFAQAYVIGHEIGHHLQRVSGMKVQTSQLTNGKWNNALGVRQELQADCFAGVWAHSANARKLVEVGDVDKALTAASAVGDDKLRPDLKPESFTHGSAEQRMRWFKVGFDSGKLDACDTFGATRL